MECYRHTPTAIAPPRPAVHNVGVFVVHSEITHERITMRIIHEWSDVIGKRIDPLAASGWPHFGQATGSSKVRGFWSFGTKAPVSVSAKWSSV